MDLFLLFVVIGAAFAVRAAWRHATEARADSRAAALKTAAKKSPAPLSNARKQMVARQHDLGWWGSEMAHGFPVLRTGLHAGWLAHKAATLQGRHKVEEARTTHAELSADFAAAMAEHKKRQDEALAQIRDQLTDPAAGKEAVQKAAGKVLPFAPRPKAADPAPSAEPVPGPYAPKETPPANPEWWEAAKAGRCSHGGHGDDETCDDYKPDDSAPHSTERNRSMPTGTATDATYDGTQRELTQMAVKLEAAINEIRFEQFQNAVEQVAATVSDPQTLGDLSDTADELQRAKAALQRAEETVRSAKSSLRHNHGHLNEAHQSNPVEPADKPFYQEG